MGTTYINPASNISYTSKDFLTIFPDLLALAKELSSRWDPSISNESDPGIVLLKINAILGDKLNYNIDKNVLEAFPLSLTQMSSARKIYALLGYRMKWYNSAWCDVTISWLGDYDTETEDNYVTIPNFTTITDDNNAITYTLVGEVGADLADGEFNPTDLTLSISNSKEAKISARAILGLSKIYNINDETVIKITDLDSENKLYFSTTNIPENGIFIKNTGSKLYDWKRVNNLLTEKLGNKYFEFGVTDDLYSCYIEFPEDAEDLIRDGIEITYVTTDGTEGGVTAATLTKFSNNLYLTDVNNKEVTLTTDNISITNLYASVDSRDPETINEAYKNYKYLVGTFDTLVTLRDYLNAIMRSDLVSNGLVCDSTNDILCAYTVKSVINGVDTDSVLLEKIELDLADGISIKGDMSGYYKNGKFYDFYDKELTVPEGTFITDLNSIDESNPDVYYSTGSSFVKIKTNTKHTFGLTYDAINSINIKLYLLKNEDIADPAVGYKYLEYNKTFDMLPNLSLSTVKEYLKTEKHIGHDYSQLLSTTEKPGSSRPCMFKNKYVITARIYTSASVSDTAKTAIKKNVILNFYNTLNSKEVTFGEAVQLDNVSNIIKNSDDRIKTVYVDSIKYDTYGVYYDGKVDSTGTIVGNFVETLISDSDSAINTVEYSAFPFVSSTNYQKGDMILLNGHRYRCLRNNVTLFVETAWTKDEYEFEIEYDEFVKCLVDADHDLGDLNYDGILTIRTEPTKTFWQVQNHDGSWSKVENLSDYGITLKSGTIYYNSDESITEEDERPDYVKFRISKATQIRDEVYAKSILAGKTPLLEKQETAMDYSFLNPYINTYKNVAEVEGSVDIYFDKDYNYETIISTNELLLFYAPAYEYISEYSSYVKMEYHLDKDIPKNTNRKLNSGEYIIFYYLPSSDSSEIYEYHAYGMNSIINLTFDLLAGDSATLHILSTATTPGILPIDSLIPTDLAVIPSGWKKTRVGGDNASLSGHVFFETYTNYNGTMPVQVSEEIDDIVDNALILIDTKKATINALSITSIDNTCYCYWVLNTKDSSVDTAKTTHYNYILFDVGDTERILNNGEYFIYTDLSCALLYIYGLGTKLTRLNTGTVVSVTADVDYAELFDVGAILTSGKFYLPDAGEPITCIKNQSIYLGEGGKVKLVPKSGATDVPSSVVVNSEGVIGYLETEAGWIIITNPLNKFTIYYSSENEVDYTNQLTDIIDSKLGWDALSMLAINLNLDSGLILKANLKVIIYGDAWSTESIDYTDSLTVLIDANWETLDACTTVGELKTKLTDIFKAAGIDQQENVQILLKRVGTALNIEAAKKIVWQARKVIITGTTILGKLIKTYNSPALSFKTEFDDYTSEYTTKAYKYLYYPVCLFANKQINIATAGKSEVVEYTDDGEIVYVDISIANYNLSSTPLSATTTSSGGVVLSIVPPEELEVTTNAVIYPVKLMAGDYITRLSSSSSEITELYAHFLCAKEQFFYSTGKTTYTVRNGSTGSKPTTIPNIYVIKNDLANPSIIKPYGSGCLFECKLNNDPSSGTSRTIYYNNNESKLLQKGEYIAFYYLDTDRTGLYKCDIYGEGTFIDTTFNIYTDPSDPDHPAVGHVIIDKILTRINKKNPGTLESPNWDLNITQRHYNLLLVTKTISSETTLIDKLTTQHKLSDSRVCTVGIPSDYLKDLLELDNEYSYDASTGKITFKADHTPLKDEVYIVIITSDLEYILGSDIQTMYGEKNLLSADKTPVKFTVFDDYDPVSYGLPIYLAARIKVDESLEKLNNTETITINNPSKYVYSSLIPASKVEKYITLVRNLDIKKAFNYSYDIKEEEMIKYPLDPMSFLNSNHPYNKCTICQFSGSINDLDIVEKE